MLLPRVCHVLSITTSICPASNGERDRPSAAAAKRDCRAKVEAYAKVGKRAAIRRREEPGRLVGLPYNTHVPI